MSLLTAILFALTLVVSGGYAGILLMCQIGILPGMRRLNLATYAEAWRAMDTYMDRRMPPYKLTLLLLNAATLACMLAQHRTRLAIYIGLSLILNAADLALNIGRQLPLNRTLQTLPADAAETTLLDIRNQTCSLFSARFALSGAAFILLCIAATF